MYTLDLATLLILGALFWAAGFAHARAIAKVKRFKRKWHTAKKFIQPTLGIMFVLIVVSGVVGAVYG